MNRYKVKIDNQTSSWDGVSEDTGHTYAHCVICDQNFQNGYIGGIYKIETGGRIDSLYSACESHYSELENFLEDRRLEWEEVDPNPIY